MDLIRRFQAGMIARRLQEGTSGADVSAAQDQLVALGPPAIRTIFDAIARGRPSRSSIAVLERLLTNNTLAEFVEALQSPSATVVDAAVEAMSRGTGYDPAQLLPLFSDPSVSKARLEAVLADQAHRIAPVTFIRVLPDLGKEGRGNVFRLLENCADESILGDAIRLADHEDWWLRLHAIKLLARFASAPGTTAMIQRLKDDNPAVRLEATHTLGRLKPAEAIAPLCGRLRDPDLKVQGAAIEALIAIGDAASVPQLLDYLKDESEYVRRGAVEVLNQVVTVEAIKDLVSALRDSDWWVRVRAADALGTLGGSRVIDAVVGLVHDPDEFIRRYAVEILNTVPDRRAVDALISALEDEDWWVRERAIDALAKTADPKAVEPLQRMLGRDLRVAPLCLRALGQIGDPRAIDMLCQLSGSENADIRRESLHALMRFTRIELDAEVRGQVFGALEKAGVEGDRTRTRPLEMRAKHSPEAGRDEIPQRRTPSRGVDGVSHGGGAGGRGLNFQKLDPGTVLLERFRVLQRIGGGGFGTVYLVEDTVVGEELVLKVLSAQLSLDDNMIRRFVQELKLTRRITHRNVIRIHDLLDLQGAHAISMEHFDGRDLGTVLKQEGPLSVARVVAIAEQVLEGLAVAHELGIVHRDIKPANLLVGEGDLVKIVDFGLASVGQGTRSRLTQSGILVGTPEYISPEQITGHDIDGRTDLYSLGVVLYEAMSGRQPFAGTNAVNVIFQHLESQVPPLDSVAAGVPAKVSELIMRCMSRFANDRPASANAMLEMLRPAA